MKDVKGDDWMRDPSMFPLRNKTLRRAATNAEVCPECGDELDTGWECTNRACEYDAKPDRIVSSEELIAAGAGMPRPRKSRWA